MNFQRDSQLFAILRHNAKRESEGFLCGTERTETDDVPSETKFQSERGVVPSECT